MEDQQARKEVLSLLHNEKSAVISEMTLKINSFDDKARHIYFHLYNNCPDTLAENPFPPLHLMYVHIQSQQTASFFASCSLLLCRIAKDILLLTKRHIYWKICGYSLQARKQH